MVACTRPLSFLELQVGAQQPQRDPRPFLGLWPITSRGPVTTTTGSLGSADGIERKCGGRRHSDGPSAGHRGMESSFLWATKLEPDLEANSP